VWLANPIRGLTDKRKGELTVIDAPTRIVKASEYPALSGEHLGRACHVTVRYPGAGHLDFEGLLSEVSWEISEPQWPPGSTGTHYDAGELVMRVHMIGGINA
jgi:hypothetical protein